MTAVRGAETSTGEVFASALEEERSNLALLVMRVVFGDESIGEGFLFLNLS